MDYLDGPTQPDQFDIWAGNDRSLDRITVLAAFRMLASGQLSDKLGLEEVPRFPVEPPDGSVLKFVRTLGNQARQYTYTALRCGQYWYTSAVRDGKITWPELVEAIGNNSCWISTGWAEIPTPEPSPFEEMTPAEWHAAMWPKNATVEGDIEKS